MTVFAGNNFIFAAFLSAMIAAIPPGYAADHGRAAVLTHQVTEEGQSVVFDAYTWQRRELAKRLPLDRPWPPESKIAQTFRKYGLDKPPMPEFLPAPAEILPDIYLVGSNPNHTYLIDGGSGHLTLIDPGLVSNFDTIIANIKKLGFSPKAIKWVINTHAHFDHSMANGLFRKLGAKILIGKDDADAVEKGTLVTAKFMLSSKEVANYPKTKVDWPLSDGEELYLGNKTFIVIHTPGHTAGSSCLLLQLDGRNILFSGDTLLYDNRLGTQSTAYADNRAYLASLEKLEHFTLTFTNHPIRWDVLLPGHGALVLNRAYMDVLKGLRTVQIDRFTGQPVEAYQFSTEDYRQLMFGRP